MIQLVLLLITIITIFPMKESEDKTINTMTFNIRYGRADDGDNSWEHRKDLVFKVIRESGCDFIGLQEALVFQIQEILEHCPSYTYTGVTREVDPKKGEASPLLYDKDKWQLLESQTLWLSETPEIPGSKSWNSSFPRIFTWGRFKRKNDDTEILIYNTHYDHMSALARHNSSRTIIEHIYSKTNGMDVILMGDFNDAEDKPPITYLTTNPVQLLKDAYRILHNEPSEMDMTFYGWKPHTPGTGKRLDYIFFLGDIIPVSAEVITYNLDGRYPSDHMPVQVEFTK